METILHMVVRSEDIELVGVVIEAGVAVNTKDKCKATSLHIACQYGLIDVRTYIHESIPPSSLPPPDMSAGSWSCLTSRSLVFAVVFRLMACFDWWE